MHRKHDRIAGLPNNAQLELTAAKRARVDSEVILAVSLDDGNRLVGQFLPDESLWDILLTLCPNEVVVKQNPVVVYMRNEVYGEEKLQNTTLRSLGLRGGRAVVRLIHKSPEQLSMQAGVSAPLTAKPAEPQRYTVETDQNNPPHVIQKKQELDFVQLLAREREKRKLESPSKAVEPEVQSPRTKPKIESTDESMEVEVQTSNNEKTVKPAKKVQVAKVYDHEENFVFLGDRQAMLFSLESARSLPAEDLPDDFFELTIDDAKKILHDIKRKRHEMENANLMTAAMRTLEESKKQLRQLHKYKQSVIRVQFPDRTILQGSFKPRETIQDVKNFVKNYLEEENLDFHLYTTPPKSILNEQDCLLEIGCVPGALLHLSSNAEKTVSLKSELKDKFTTNSMASLAASKLRKETTRVEEEPEGGEDDSMEISSDTNVPGPSSQPTSYERKVIKSTEKVPKWFKPSK
ncbi:tether containing UBX domain for GLUT4 isoform X3 [Zophobas morio]|uniref:tether containing UBX domain for GLUT4 isoform X3 n=1 Tax=Zophobas morio TaxID=2755281 RepID=UPI003082D78B